MSTLAGPPQSFPISTDLSGLQDLSPALQTHNREVLYMRGRPVSNDNDNSMLVYFIIIDLRK